jgi:diaminopimelate epimerase
MEDNIPFFKMSGSGNDFILVDNRDGIVSGKGLRTWIASVCRRKHAVGADGLILIEHSRRADFKWRYFNADGGEADMCGNGGRCVARLANMIGIAGEKLRFETKAGTIKAEVKGNKVKLEMPEPSAIILEVALQFETQTISVSTVTIGVPHTVLWVDDIEVAPVSEMGPAIRYHEQFDPDGTNVNFVQTLDDGSLAIRTYERGVEDETLACGTGSVAAALVAAEKNLARSPGVVRTRGGEALNIHFKKQGTRFNNVFLEGDAKLVYRGKLYNEATDS